MLVDWRSWEHDLIDVTGYLDPFPVYLRGRHEIDLWDEWEWIDE